MTTTSLLSYSYFVSGLAMIALAVMVRRAARQTKLETGWHWLVTAILLLAGGDWLLSAELHLESQLIVSAAGRLLNLGLHVLALFAAIEFAQRQMLVTRDWLLNRWAMPVMAAACLTLALVWKLELATSLCSLLISVQATLLACKWAKRLVAFGSPRNVAWQLAAVAAAVASLYAHTLASPIIATLMLLAVSITALVAQQKSVSGLTPRSAWVRYRGPVTFAALVVAGWLVLGRQENVVPANTLVVLVANEVQTDTSAANQARLALAGRVLLGLLPIVACGGILWGLSRVSAAQNAAPRRRRSPAA